VSDRRPADVTREIYATWVSGQLGALGALVRDDVAVSGYLTDGRPLHGKEAVLAMVASFTEADGIELVDVEELSADVALLQMRMGANGSDAVTDSYWLWTFEGARLKESHAFLSRDAALSWFGAQSETR
jgi:ketosteroid isomerase-like protein